MLSRIPRRENTVSDGQGMAVYNCQGKIFGFLTRQM